MPHSDVWDSCLRKGWTVVLTWPWYTPPVLLVLAGGHTVCDLVGGPGYPVINWAWDWDALGRALPVPTHAQGQWQWPSPGQPQQQVSSWMP
jgi:hypothetical protein